MNTYTYTNKVKADPHSSLLTAHSPKLLLFLLLALLLQSCITEVDTDDFYSPPVLVLYARLSPDAEEIKVSLTRSRFAFANDSIGNLQGFDDTYDEDYERFPQLANGKVEISNDNVNWFTIPFHTEKNRFVFTQADFPIEEGKQYYIRASHNGFEDISATCKVPIWRETNAHITIEEAINDYHHGSYETNLHYHVLCKWQDYPGEQNFYMFYRNSNGNLYPTLMHDYDNETCYFSDVEKDGESMHLLIDIYYGTGGQYYNSNVFMVQMDRNEYLYCTSLEQYYNSVDFIMEPVQIYINIENGLGVFSGFCMRKVNEDY